jgi:threonine/homoserine/homoserine lactone efflux protein
VAAVAFGVGALVERSAEIFAVVKWAGAAYLVYLGVQAIWHRQSMAGALAARITPVRPLRALRDGFVVGATNPKSIVFRAGRSARLSRFHHLWPSRAGGPDRQMRE